MFFWNMQSNPYRRGNVKRKSIWARSPFAFFLGIPRGSSSPLGPICLWNWFHRECWARTHTKKERRISVLCCKWNEILLSVNPLTCSQKLIDQTCERSRSICIYVKSVCNKVGLHFIVMFLQQPSSNLVLKGIHFEKQAVYQRNNSDILWHFPLHLCQLVCIDLAGRLFIGLCSYKRKWSGDLLRAWPFSERPACAIRRSLLWRNDVQLT